jgi:hypothetical protein
MSLENRTYDSRRSLPKTRGRVGGLGAWGPGGLGAWGPGGLGASRGLIGPEGLLLVDVACHSCCV